MARPNAEILEERKKFVGLIKECAEKPSVFSERFLEHKLHKYNAEYVDCMERFIMYRSGRQAGKTMSTAAKTVHFAFFAPLYVHDPAQKECIILIAAPTQNQATIMFERIKLLINNSDFLSGYIIRNTQTEIWLKTLDNSMTTKIITRATGETGATLRGYSPDVIIADECAFMKQSIMIAFLPSGLAKHVRVWITSTPYGKTGYFYDQHLDSRPNNPDGVWREFHVRSIDNPFVKDDPLFLTLIKGLTKDEYQQEVLGEFLDIGDALIPHNLLMEAISDKKPQGHVRYFMGLDIARTGLDETVFTVIQVDGNDVVYVTETIAEKESNLVDVAGKVGDLCRKYPIETVYVDETGLGSGVVDLARRQDLPIRGITFTLSEKSQMYKTIRRLFEQHRVKIPELERHGLITQLGLLKAQYTDEGNLKVRTEEKASATGVARAHDDYADSFALACNAVSFDGSWHLLTMSDELNKSMFG